MLALELFLLVSLLPNMLASQRQKDARKVSGVYRPSNRNDEHQILRVIGSAERIYVGADSSLGPLL